MILNTKPDWKDAPEWAKYLACDKDGSWVWFEEEPGRNHAFWHSTRGAHRSARVSQPDWEQSLEQRPL